MSGFIPPERSFSTAVGRWAGLGPYYAMFPVEFAFDVVRNFTEPGQAVLDPFAGRASSVYAAATQGRPALGIEINSVGWLYGRVKLCPAPVDQVLERLQSIGRLAECVRDEALDALPEFFRVCYTRTVLRFLLAARSALRWKSQSADATLMALLLVYLHGKRCQSLSNQMRQGKAMSPDYCLRWWAEREAKPPEVDPVGFLQKRVAWRYGRGVPEMVDGRVLRGDSTELTGRLAQVRTSRREPPVELLFTSPPYYGVTNYHYDQWLRLWILGGAERPRRTGELWKGKFESQDAYRCLLQRVFGGAAQLTAPEATIYVRTDARRFTRETTLSVLQSTFPRKTVETVPRPFTKNTQTALFGDKASKPGEVDLILRA